MSDIHLGKPTPRLLYPSLVTAAIAVTIFSLVGIAAITGHLPNAAAGLAPVGAVTGNTEHALNAAPASTPAGELAGRSCAECGVVESIHAVEVRGSGSGLGAVLGGLGGALVGNTLGGGNGRTAMTLIGGGAGAYAGNEIERSSHRHTVWRTRVRMDDGTVHTLTTQYQPDFGVGSKVRVVDGRLLARG